MKNANDSCNRRGCEVGIILPHDSMPKHIHMEMLRAKHDIQKVLPITIVSMDNKLEKKEQMEKKAA